MKILLTTDSFPPSCGGSGWSTYELARGLRRLGHDVLVLEVSAGSRAMETERTYDGLRVIDWQAWAPDVPGVRNYFKNERLYPRLQARIERLIAELGVALVHGQHVLSSPPSVSAARAGRIPSVVTVRDYWPVCYRSDLLHTPLTRSLCPGCSSADHVETPLMMTAPLWLPRAYLRRNVRTKAQALQQAGAVIAVSSVIRRDLLARAPGLSGSRVEVIHNPVDVDALRARAGGPPPLAEPYALYAGKLAANKGTDLLVAAITEAELDWPLVVVGDGPHRRRIEAEARASGRDVRFAGWQDPDVTARWMANAQVLIFPSRGPESLSRVLIEASALGLPIAAINTGGTADIIEDEVTGLLAEDVHGLADRIRRIRHGEILRQRLGAAAERRARERFDAPAVVSRIASLYDELLSEARQ